MDEHIRARLPDVTLDHAKHMRRAPTDAERTLWLHLRRGRFDGLRFRRQHAIPPYIVDFYCHAARLVIELDGSQHNEDVDAHRTLFLESKGLRLLRFWDNDVLAQTEAVLEAIWNAVGTRPLSPTPLPQGEGLETTRLNAVEPLTPTPLPVGEGL